MGFLLNLVVFVTFFRANITKIVSLLLAPTSSFRVLAKYAREMQEVNNELRKLRLPNDFVLSSKLQRKKIALEKAIQTATEKRNRELDYVTRVINGVLTLCIIFVIMMFRAAIVVKIPQQWLGWPFSWLFFWAKNAPGSITLPCWLIISSRSAVLITDFFQNLFKIETRTV